MSRIIVVLIISAGFARISLAQTGASACDSAFAAFESHVPLKQSIHNFQACAAVQPKSGFPHFDLGLLFEADDQLGSAKLELQTAIRLGLRPELGRAAENELSIIDKKIAATAPEAKRQLEREQERAEAKLYLATHQDAAALALARALARDPSATWNDHALYGASAMATHHFDEASSALLEARQKAPAEKQADIDALLKRCAAEIQYRQMVASAQHLLVTHNLLQAADLFAAAWRIFPERSDAAVAAITCYLATPQSSRSFPILDALAESDDQKLRAQAVSLRARLANDDKRLYERHHQAAEILRVAVAKYKNPEDLSDLSGKKLTALESEANRALSIDPNLVAAHELLAFCLSHEKKYAQAAEQYRDVLAINPRARVNLWLAWVLWKENELDAARQALVADAANPAKADGSVRSALIDALKPPHT